MRIKTLILVALCTVALGIHAQNFNGLDMNMGNLSRLSNAKTRSISPENYTGEKGKGGMADPVKDKDKRNVANAHHAAKDLGKGWKVNPFIIVNPGETITIAEIEGPGAIQQIWMTPTGNWRFSDAVNRRYMNFSELNNVGMKFEPKNQGVQYVDIQHDTNSVTFL